MHNSHRFVRDACVVALGLLTFSGCTSNDTSKPKVSAQSETSPAVTTNPQPLSTEDAVLATVTAEVAAIDHETRELTLKDAGGVLTTLTVGPQVKRLDEVNVGDRVTANYYGSLAGELRAPTAEEKEHPVVILEGAGRAPRSEAPAASALRAFKVVTVVEGIDLAKQTVTLRGQGPLRQGAVVRAKSPDNLKKIRVGDTIVVTYTEALAISLEKAPAPPRE